ncbi:MAG TPA: hypothetical protein VFG31_03070 [Conexibacter sp.]|nr:hypothetical protein [Conexibacter sp.]
MRAALRRVLWFLPGWGAEGSPRLDQDWRLRAAFDVRNGVADVFERLRGRERFLGSEVGGLLPFGVVLSRRDDALFVYAATRSGIDGARVEIERVVCAMGLSADVRVSRWDDGLGKWRQIDPPLAGGEHELDDVRAREASRPQTRELSCLVGRLDRPFVEGPLLDFAQRRGLDCTVEGKRHLLSVRLTFSVSGPAYKLDEFADQVRHVVRSQLSWVASGP